MATLKGFLNPIKVEERDVIISDRFIGEDGQPLPFRIKPLSAEVINAIEQESVEADSANKNRSKNKRKYENGLLAASVVSPDLNAVDIQDAYGASSAWELIDEMLLVGEKARLVEAIYRLNGLDKSLDDMVKEAKN